MSGVWSHKFDYHQHHSHALYAYLHVNTCVITFLYDDDDDDDGDEEREKRVYYVLGGNWTLVLSSFISFFFSLFSFLVLFYCEFVLHREDPNKMNEQKCAK